MITIEEAYEKGAEAGIRMCERVLNDKGLVLSLPGWDGETLNWDLIDKMRLQEENLFMLDFL